MSDVLDTAILERLQRELGGDPQRVATILSVFLEEIGPYRADLLASAERNDTHDTVFGAHRLGSASVLIGATRLTAIFLQAASSARASSSLQMRADRAAPPRRARSGNRASAVCASPQ